MDTAIRIIAATDEIVLVETNPEIKVTVDDAEIVIASEATGMRGEEGQQGLQGPPGPKGNDGEGATDPGDLTLIFNNKLI